ncbi:hypothetical protein Tco_0128222 [Tanacetum coccineum]
MLIKSQVDKTELQRNLCLLRIEVGGCSNERWMDCGLQKSDWSGWVVVTVENKDNWLWFLLSLGDDLNLNRGATVTIISDGHKGLKEA